MREGKSWMWAPALLAAAALALLWGKQRPEPGMTLEPLDLQVSPGKPEASPEPPPPPAPPALPTAPAPHAEPAPPAATAAPTEEQEMARLRALVDADPAGALALAREAEALFPAGRFADERSLLSMRALVHLEKIALARDQATLFFEKHEGSAWAEQVERLTGVHPQRAGHWR
jgi:hypothetical protein